MCFFLSDRVANPGKTLANLTFDRSFSRARVTRMRFQIVPFSFCCVFQSFHFGLHIQMFAFS